MKKQLQEILDKFINIGNISYKETIEIQREIERMQEIAKEGFFEENNKIIAQVAWEISGNYKCGYNIGYLCNELEKDFEMDAQQTFKAIYDGLEQLSEENYTFWENNNGYNYREVATYGYCIISGIDCYWYWTENGDGEWTCDKPGFWEEMIEKWEKQDEEEDDEEENEEDEDEDDEQN